MGKQYAQLTVEERVEIYRLHTDGKSRRAIAACLGRSAATISRELGRNSVPTKAWEGGYAPLRAQALTDRRRQRGRPHKLTSSPELRAAVRGYLEQGWSPEQIAGRLRRTRGPVKRQFVCKRWTIERAGESSSDTPWFGTHRLNIDTLRFLPPSLPSRGCGV